MTTETTKEIGKEKEQLACAYLEKQGLKLIQANYNTKCGEIDLIMIDKETLVFVEVRYRKETDYGSGADSIISSKKSRIIRTAKLYLQKYHANNEPPCRFDVIAITPYSISENIEWIKDAFWVKWQHEKGNTRDKKPISSEH